MPNRPSELGDGNLTRAVLTGLSESGRRTNLPMRSTASLALVGFARARTFTPYVDLERGDLHDDFVLEAYVEQRTGGRLVV